MRMSEEKKQVTSINRRRENRVAAMQFLYMYDLNREMDLDTAVRVFFSEQERPRDFYAFAEELVYGCWEQLPTIDQSIEKHVRNWKFNRIAKVDLAILRLAIYEMLFRPDIPPVVTINEAVDLGKAFSNSEAKRFINGILDRVKEDLKRPLRSPADGFQ